MSTHHDQVTQFHADSITLVTDLIDRGRAALARPDWKSKFDGLTDEQLLSAIESNLVIEAQKIKLMPSHGTTIACTKCGRLEAPAYYLKRSHGRYAVLCFSGGEGCWEHSSHANCSYVDQYSSQCMDLAEWVVAYGSDMLKERQVCSLHVAAVLSDATVHKVFALED